MSESKVSAHTVGLWGVDPSALPAIPEHDDPAYWYRMYQRREAEASQLGGRIIALDEQVSALRASHAELREALQGLIGWIPNEAAMARMGFHTDAPVNAHKKAQAALAAAKDLT